MIGRKEETRYICNGSFFRDDRGWTSHIHSKVRFPTTVINKEIGHQICAENPPKKRRKNHWKTRVFVIWKWWIQKELHGCYGYFIEKEYMQRGERENCKIIIITKKAVCMWVYGGLVFTRLRSISRGFIKMWS